MRRCSSKLVVPMSRIRFISYESKLDYFIDITGFMEFYRSDFKEEINFRRILNIGV